jgi:hypothetical protein
MAAAIGQESEQSSRKTGLASPDKRFARRVRRANEEGRLPEVEFERVEPLEGRPEATLRLRLKYLSFMTCPYGEGITSSSDPGRYDRFLEELASHLRRDGRENR